MQMVIVIISVAVLLLFIWPWFANRILCIGNLTGMLLAGLGIFYGVNMQEIHGVIAKLWQSTSGRFFLSFVCGIAFVILGCVILETLCMVMATCHRPKEAMAAIVLGCKVNGSIPCQVLEERIHAAYEYLHKNPEVLCVLSGGQGEDEDVSEAHCMYEALIKKGIAEERLILEEKSTNTEENFRFSLELIEQYQLNKRVVIITSEFHQYRASIWANRVGLEGFSISSKTHLKVLPTYYMRELYAIAEQWFLK